MPINFWKRLFGMSSVDQPEGDPSLKVKTLVFSDDSVVDIGNRDVVVFVGPNNSGKSMALRQIQRIIADSGSYNVIKACKVDRVGDADTMEQHIRDNSRLVTIHGYQHLVGYDYRFRVYDLKHRPSEINEGLRDFFVFRMPTEDRLTGSDPVKAISYWEEQPSHPIHLLVTNRELENRLSSLFRKAFGYSVYVNRAGGIDVGLYVGSRENSELPEDEFSAESRDFFKDHATPIRYQGDGMRAFATLALNTIATSQQRVMLIDEPEAFLHPPQARLLGRVLATEGSAERQYFIATHSSDLLKGVLEGDAHPVKIIRINRKGNVNYIKVLEPSIARDLAKDPIVRYSGLFDGIFYKHIVICESDADCQFYSAILSSNAVSGETEPDVLFVQSSGKHRVAKLAQFAGQLGIPCTAILDIDLINDKSTFKSVIEGFGLEWTDIETPWKIVFESVNQQKARLSLSQVISSIQDAVERARSNLISLTTLVSEVRDAVRQNSPWDAIKRAGRNALPRGEVTKAFDEILDICSAGGLWIVPIGELESFCPSATSKKSSSWTVDVLEKYDPSTSEELLDARLFIASIWKRIEEIS